MADGEVDSFAKVDEGRRTVYLTGSVDSRMAFYAVEALERLDSTEGDIRIVLNSEGGSEQDGYTIFDVITMCQNRVVIHGHGSVMSIAAAIFQAGDERMLSPNALFMVHNGTVSGDEKMEQNHVIELAEQIKKDNGRYYRILHLGSSLPREQVEEMCAEETFLTAEETVAYGFADGVLTPNKLPWSDPRFTPKKPRKKRKKP